MNDVISVFYRTVSKHDVSICILQDKKSTKNLCQEIAKSGDVNYFCCQEKCRFSHDIEAFKEQVGDVISFSIVF